MDNVIESYLIALGVDIDKSDFAEADKAINGLSAKIISNAAQWGKASGIVIGAISGIVGSITGLVASAAKQDLAMQKYATSMMISTGQATKMKEALDALGESAADVQTNMELRSRYNALLQDAQQIMPDGDYSAAMKQVRDIMFEFTRLKQEASYAIKWISYYLVKDFIGPLEKAGFSLRSMNEYIQRNMPRITRNIADGLGYIINIGLNFMRAIRSLGMLMLNIWDRLPHSIKVSTVAIGAFFALLRASPVGRLVAVISMLLLLDDFYAYMDGKESEFGPYWQKLIDFWNSISDDVDAATDAVFNFLKTISESPELAEFTGALQELLGAVWDLIVAIGTLVADTFGALWDALEEVGLVDDFSESMKTLLHYFAEFIKLVAEVIKAIAKFLKELGKTEGFRQFIRLLGEFLGILWDIVSTIVGAVYDALRGLWDIFKDLGVPREFTDAIGEMLMAFIELAKGVANLIKLMIKLFKWLVGDPRVMPFWKDVGVALGNLVNVLSTVLSKLGKIGRVIGLLLQGKFAEAAAIMGFGGGGAPDLGEVNGNAAAGVEALVKGGMTEVAAAGLIGNMTAESSLDHTTSIIDSNGLRSIGIAQWNGKRADKLEAYLNSKGITDLSDSRAFGAQLEYAIKEMKEDFPEVWSALQNAKTVQEASDIILTQWEKPEDQSQSVKDYRGGLANQAYSAYSEIKNTSTSNSGGGVGDTVKEMASSVGQAIQVQYNHVAESVGNKIDEIKEGAARLYDSIGTMTGQYGGPSYFVNPATTSTSNSIGDINVYVTNSNASASDIGKAVGSNVSRALNMPERPIVAVRERRGGIG